MGNRGLALGKGIDGPAGAMLPAGFFVRGDPFGATVSEHDGDEGRIPAEK
ncbi:hypothetical protein BN871_BK_00200 [Paenibacillus sp. P22]|nr:hypothetical protein BN871_BK_00200 [Paenibacillus sp. P22]